MRRPYLLRVRDPKLRAIVIRRRKEKATEMEGNT